MAERLRVVHLAVDHKPFDVRIFEKECRSLAAAGHEVHLVIPEAVEGPLNGVYLHGYVKPSGGFRPMRILRRLRNAYHAAQRLHGDLYHFHECSLIPVALCLKLGGATVVYDVHEDFLLDALATHRGRPLRASITFLTWWLFEAVGRRAFDGFVAATPAIARRFPRARTALVQNYPRLADFPPVERTGETPAIFRLAYAGGLSEIRGLREITHALALLPPKLPIRLSLLGEFFDHRLARELADMPGWSRVDYLGFQPRQNMVQHLAECRVGLILFRPDRSHLAAQPNKLFEYMAAGLAVIASDFPLWRQIIEQSGCGVLVDPLDPTAISEAIASMAERPDQTAAMGARGRHAAIHLWNWEQESRHLVRFYADLIARRHNRRRLVAASGGTR